MIARLFLKICNGIVSLVLVLALLISGAYAAYALWDNNQVLSAAENVQADLLQFKPRAEPSAEGEEDNSASFEDLLAINPDVVGWVTMDATKIDFPVLQGQNNLTYINKDVYGNFALAGSIYLDSRNARDFSDPYSLLYGHHMANGNMFGDLDLYKEEAFFRENRTGTLILPDKTYKLEIISCMLVSASDDYIFEPEYTQDHIDSLLDYAEKKSLFFHEDTLRQVREAENPQILALSTCSSEFTDARTIVLTVMK